MTKKYFKTGENRKLSPRRGGPWTIIEKCPNGVNFRVRCDTTREEKVVHHDRLYPVKYRDKELEPQRNHSTPSRYDSNDTTHEPSSEDEDSGEYYELSSTDDAGPRPVDIERLYPRRNRKQRIIPGVVPWSQVHL